MKQQHRLVSAALATLAVLIALTATTSARGGAACSRARRDLEQARAELASTTRSADQRASSYYACMERSRNDGRACRPQKRALDRAMSNKRAAQRGYRFAAAREREACR